MVPALFLFDFRFDASPFPPRQLVEHPILRRGRICALLCDMELVGRCAWSGKTSAYIYMVPVITIAASVIILQEKLTWVAFAEERSHWPAFIFLKQNQNRS